ncbi:hypothetical protein D3C84_1306040 [compost metagenome]
MATETSVTVVHRRKVRHSTSWIAGSVAMRWYCSMPGSGRVKLQPTTPANGST